jgi:hypothetical protein
VSSVSVTMQSYHADVAEAEAEANQAEANIGA